MTPYYISGHGGELSSTMTIPENCIVILKTHSGEVSYKRYFDKICSLPLHVLQNPLNHVPAIIKAFGSVAIYTAGDKCPDMEYHLTACYGKPYTQCETYGSGVLDLESVMDDDVCGRHAPEVLDRFKDLDEHLSYDGIISAIAYMYRFSVDPTDFYIRDVLDTLEAREEIMAIAVTRDKLTMTDKCNLCIDYLIRHGHIVRKQSELFGGRTAGPAVFYNFICRSKESARGLYGKAKRSTFRAPFIPPKSFPNRRKKLSDRTRVVLERIEEAEIHRKRALRNYYSAEKSKTRKRRSNLKTPTEGSADADNRRI